ncbi:MAG: ABC transporter permease [Clostridiales Family XIII bacterium]|jgi:putative ABC transport system permease protein|nr:ABC transporter permease [Clostridiales Family XIII bacterium]
MNFRDNIGQAFTSLKANKMRALLTMLGIIIGISAVIAIMTMGNSMTVAMTEQFQELGVNNVTVYVQQKEDEFAGGRFGGGYETTDKDLLTDEMLADLREQYPDDIDAFSLAVGVGNGQTTQGSKYANLTLLGVNAEYKTTNNIEITRGRFVDDGDSESRKKVVVVSDKLVSNIFGEEDPIGKSILVELQGYVGTYVIIGVYEAEDSAMGPSTSSEADVVTEAYIPLKTAQLIMKVNGYEQATVMTAAGVNATEFTDKITGVLNKYYSRNEHFEIAAFSMESMVESITSMLNMMTLVIAAIAAIALLVGGIGVMNIMLVSITERTREIGVRKALGATNGEIRAQFIVEAIVICMIGGIIGIIVGILLGIVGTAVIGNYSGGDMEFKASVSVPSILLATGFSMAIGIFFGYYPANKAAKLDPIDALRFE